MANKLFICSLLIYLAGSLKAQTLPSEALDSRLLLSNGSSWWFKTSPSGSAMTLENREATANEMRVVEKVKSLMVSKPAKAFALVDGKSIVHVQYNSPANADSLFYGLSIGKTATAMAVGKAICARLLTLENKAEEFVPELLGTALGKATVHDLLRMSSGTTDGNADSTIFTDVERKDWFDGRLDLVTLLSSPRVSSAKKGLFSPYIPGEQFHYKATDPLLLGVMIARAANTTYPQWLQEQVFTPAGFKFPGLYIQNMMKQGAADNGLRLRLEDWIRFAVWIKASTYQEGCFGNFVRSAFETQIRNNGRPADRKFGYYFGGYGYFLWTENSISRNSVYASGYGGQRIAWNLKNDRMVVAFSNLENWMESIYEVARDWGDIPSK
jgi:CubicO group peptidase (beta-lactamase class C family)